MSAAGNDKPRRGALCPADLRQLPPERHDLPSVAALVARAGRKVVVLDDDPTGTQTVHGFEVLTEWSERALAEALADPRPCFFVLTNSRSLAEAEAVTLNRELAINLARAARATHQAFTIISRSDSTLRGHFAAEIDALNAADERGYDGVIVAPAFFEAGRVTIGDTHYVAEGERFVPAAETEFSRDTTFGYRSSDLRDWIEEKTHGRVRASAVASIALGTLRNPNGAELVRGQLLQLSRGGFVVVNAAAYGDLEVFVHGLLQAEAAGRRFLSRTAASFVRVRTALQPQPLLDAAAMRGREGQGGLVIVGSYTEKTTTQFDRVVLLPRVRGLELDVNRLADAAVSAAELAHLRVRIDQALRDELLAVVFTSRSRESTLGRAGDLKTGRIVSDALVQLVRGITVRPRFLIAKGGITSSDIAVRGLGVRRALIVGQAEPGIPVWRTGPESRWPGLGYIVFPGNVGQPDTLRALVEKLAD